MVNIKVILGTNKNSNYYRLRGTWHQNRKPTSTRLCDNLLYSMNLTIKEQNLPLITTRLQ